MRAEGPPNASIKPLRGEESLSGADEKAQSLRSEESLSGADEKAQSVFGEESVRCQESLRGDETLMAQRAAEAESGSGRPSPSDPQSIPMPNTKSLAKPAALSAPDAQLLSASERSGMIAAGREILECYRVLEKAGLNIVGEVLRGAAEFVEFEHYPADDVFDHETHGQYYYHSHRSQVAEHGHFHTFVRAGGMPPGVAPLLWPLASEPWPQGDQAIAHIAGIAMDDWGYPVGLFATNRWVTAETWYPAEAVIRMIPAFRIDHAWPSWPVNRWISAMIRLFQAHVVALLEHRDAVIQTWQEEHPGEDVFEDRALDVTGYLPISVSAWMDELKRAEA